MLLKFIFYSIVFFPILTRGILFLNFQKRMKEALSNEELAKESHRTLILTLTGFSFSGLLAMAVLDVTLRQDFHFSIYYLLMSFLSYQVALNLQSYKVKRWQDQLATVFVDIASLCLILSILSILNLRKFSPYFAYFLSALAILIWLIDHWFRLRFQWKFLKVKKDITV